MRAIGSVLLSTAVLGAPPALAQVPLEPPELPQLPEVALPDLPLPMPTPAPTATPSPAPAPDPPPTPAEAAAPVEASRGGPPPNAPAKAMPAPAARSERAAPRRSSARPAPRSRGRREPRSAEPDHGVAIRGRVGPPRAALPTAVNRRPARAPEPATAPSTPSKVAGKVGELARAIPPAILWALAGVAAIALGLAANAFRQWRRGTALEAQRAELLDDIGILSRALLPSVPAGIDGVAVSAAYRPADGPAAGGDFYDVFMLDERRFCVLVGDVSGHGRQSVTQAALARYTLRTLLAAGHAPGNALARADALLTRDLRPNFVTVIAGVYDPDTGVLTYAKAGHSPPIVLGAAHDPGAEQPATPLGLGIGDSWPEFRLQLGAGVSVCMFTDGLEDAVAGGGRVGRDAVARLLASRDVPDAGRLLGDLEDFANQMCDDTAAIVLSRR